MQFQLHPKIITRVAIALLPVNVCHKGKRGRYNFHIAYRYYIAQVHKGYELVFRVFLAISEIVKHM